MLLTWWRRWRLRRQQDAVVRRAESFLSPEFVKLLKAPLPETVPDKRAGDDGRPEGNPKP